MSELSFSQKPRRMTSPPQNKGQAYDLEGGIEVILETDPMRIAYFAREATWGDIMQEPTEEEMADTIREVQGQKVLGAAYKSGFGFRIRASRVCMDQMLRLPEGSGGAGAGAGAQTTRDNDMRDFNIIIPDSIWNMEDGELHEMVRELAGLQRRAYAALVDAGVPPQDARYVALPLGFQTQWMMIVPFQGMIKLCEQRMCNGLTQGETNYLVRVMRDLVVSQHPFMDPLLRSACEKRGECAGSTMLFPPCRAFGPFSDDYAEVLTDDQQWNPKVHLYPASKNVEGMRYAGWDRKRVQLGEEGEGLAFSEPSDTAYPVTPKDVAEGMAGRGIGGR